MSKSHINQKRFLRRVAKKIIMAKGEVNPIKEYQAIYPNASKATAKSNSSEILNSPLGIKTMSEYLAIDYPKHKRSKRLTELADATKDHVLQDGTVIPIKDNQASLRALELMAKFDGELSDNNTNIDARSMTINLSPESIDRLSATLEELKRLKKIK